MVSFFLCKSKDREHKVNYSFVFYIFRFQAFIFNLKIYKGLFAQSRAEADILFMTAVTFFDSFYKGSGKNEIIFYCLQH